MQAAASDRHDSYQNASDEIVERMADVSRSGYVNYPQLVQDALSPRGGAAAPPSSLDAGGGRSKTAAGSLTVNPSALKVNLATLTLTQP